MSKPASARNGEQLRISDQVVPFAYWPVIKTSRRYGLTVQLFTSDPWSIFKMAIEDRCPKTHRRASHAFLEQARDFYRAAATSQTVAAKPVLLYYAYLNLAKAYVLVENVRTNLDVAQHGLHLVSNTGTKRFATAELEAHKTSSIVRPNVFDDFLRALTGPGLAANVRFRLDHLLPQVVDCNRLWTAAAGNRKDRYIGLEIVRFMHDKTKQLLWLRVFVHAHTLTRLNLSHKGFLALSGLGNKWHEVGSTESLRDNKLICFEQSSPVHYSGRPSDKILDVVDLIRPHLSSVVVLTPPYRRYYVNIAPATEHKARLHELAATYAIAFYFGSITRYKPHYFAKILASDYRGFVESFLNERPTQFLYLLASEFAQQDLARPSTV